MPYYARRRTYTRRPYKAKKYGKKYGKKRFTKKRFARNGVNQLTMRAPQASRLLRVKLPYTKSFSASFTGAGSKWYAFQGNSIFPFTTKGQDDSIPGAIGNVPTTGDTITPMISNYSQMYDKYTVNGSSIKLQIVNAASPSPFRVVLLSIPFNGRFGDVTTSAGNDTWVANLAQLNSYGYEELLSWPYAKWRMLGSSNGGTTSVHMKMFRKTKNMCGIKDLRDNGEYQAFTTDGNINENATQNAFYGCTPQSGFMYYLRIFSQIPGEDYRPFEITVRMSLYVTLWAREFIPSQIIQAPL